MVNVVELFDNAQYSFPINNVYQSNLGSGNVDQFENKQIEFTNLGTDLVFKGTNGWKVFLLANYDYEYIPYRPQPGALQATTTAAKITVNDIDNFSMKPIDMQTKYYPAGLR